MSTCTKRVRLILEELGLKYEFVSVDFSKGEHKAPAYVAKQPFGQLPYLDDDGFTLYESRAIARYLALKYGGIGKLIPEPSDLQKVALFEQAASVELSNFDPIAHSLTLENIFKPYVDRDRLDCAVSDRLFLCRMFGGKTDPAVVATLKTTLEGKLAAYDVILGKTKYLAGDVCVLSRDLGMCLLTMTCRS